MTTVRAGFRRFGPATLLAGPVGEWATTSAAPPTFSTKRTINVFVTGLLPFDVKTEDIDQDGDLDIYSANYSGRVTWFENDGGNPPGPWVEHIVTDFADGAEAAFACRVDADADIDFLSAAFTRTKSDGSGTAGTAETWT